MLDILEKIKQTEAETQRAIEEAQKQAAALLDDAEHQGKTLLVDRRHEAHRKATTLLAEAEEGQREILLESGRLAKEEADRLHTIGEKNRAAAVALIAERIVVTR